MPITIRRLILPAAIGVLLLLVGRDHAAPAPTTAPAAPTLAVPAELDPTKPLVVVIHGFNGGQWHLWDIIDCLKADGFQAAPFSYDCELPIATIADALGGRLKALRRQHANQRFFIVAHSLGGLVARAYIEGDDYSGGVEKLIMIGTPNHGTQLARLAFLMEWRNRNFRMKRPDTRPVDGEEGKASRDMWPKSRFLTELNARKRCAGVRYTMIAGNRHEVTDFWADYFESATTRMSGNRWGDKWGIRHLRDKTDDWAHRMRDKESDSDGVVSLESTRLEGVSDYIVLPADHTGLVWKDGDKPPPCYAVVKERLAR